MESISGVIFGYGVKVKVKSEVKGHLLVQPLAFLIIQDACMY